MQQSANFIMFIVAVCLVASILDGLFRLPYFSIMYPRETLAAANKWLVVRWGDTDPLLVIIWWILVPLLILNALGLLDWADKYF